MTTAGYQTLKSIPVEDWTELLVSESNTEDVPLNGSPDMQNFKCLRPGELLQRLGYGISTNPGIVGTKPDGVKAFQDANGTWHIAVWQNGNLYDWLGSSVLIKAGCYQAGKRVCSTVRKNVLYFSDGVTFYVVNSSDHVGIYTWDPTGSPAPISYTAGTGKIPAPACYAMTIYNGQLLLGATTPYGSPAEPDNVRWSDPTFPDSFMATDAYPVGAGAYGQINSLVPFAIATEALQPSDSFFIGKQTAVFLGQGAASANTLKVSRVNSSDGVLDGASVQFLGDDLNGGVVAFLGSSRRVLLTDGINVKEVSKNIRTELRNYISGQLITNASAIFTSVRIIADFQYMLDVGGGRQYVMDWRSMKWSRYVGWPSGYWTEALDNYQQPIIYAAYADGNSNNYLALANAGYTDNGALISCYWTTPDLIGAAGDEFANAGDDSILKRWVECILDFGASGKTTVKGTFTADSGRGDSGSDTVTVTGSGGTPNVYDAPGSTYDSGLTYDNPNLNAALERFKEKLYIYHQDANSKITGRVNGRNLRVKIESTQVGTYLALYSMTIRHQPRGPVRVTTN